MLVGNGAGIIEVLYLAIVLVVVGFLAYYSSRFLSKKSNSFLSGKYLNVIDRIMISNDKYILLIKAGEKIMIVGVTNQNMSLLGEMDKDEVLDLDNVQIQNKSLVNSLSNLITQGINKFKGKKAEKTSFSEWRDFFDKKNK